MRPGMMPILHLPGEMMPGQFGPIRRVFLKSTTDATRTMSMAGMPSVMQTMSGSDAADHICAVLNHLLGVEGAFAAGETLDEQASVFVDQNAHRAPPASATTFCAPSFMPSAMVRSKPLSRRIC